MKTFGDVGNESNGDVNLPGMQEGRGADGVEARLQAWQLHQQLRRIGGR